MRIALFETDHFEVTYTLVRLFDQPGNELQIFCYEESYNQLKTMAGMNLPHLDWTIKEKDESKRAFIRRMEKQLRITKTELLYLNTVTDNFISYAGLVQRLPGVRVLLTIHDIHSFFHYTWNGTIRRLVRNYGKKLLIDAVQEFAVINSTMTDYLRQLLPEGKKVRWMPGSFFDESIYAVPPSLSTINIVVPGSVDIRRRDYDQVFELLNSCQASGLADIHITLLGGVHPEFGAAVIEKCQLVSNSKEVLSWYDCSVVDQAIFDQVMQRAHFVFAPAVTRTVISDGVEELYGKSISSGNIADIIRFARPAIIPASLQTGPEMTHIALRYTGIKEIPELLKRLREDPSIYVRYCEQALQGSRGFTLERIRTLHADLFKAGS